MDGPSSTLPSSEYTLWNVHSHPLTCLTRRLWCRGIPLKSLLSPESRPPWQPAGDRRPHERQSLCHRTPLILSQICPEDAPLLNVLCLLRQDSPPDEGQKAPGALAYSPCKMPSVTFETEAREASAAAWPRNPSSAHIVHWVGSPPARRRNAGGRPG